MKYLVLVPARGGSKGVPRKNLKPICGVPLIDYSLEAGVGFKNKRGLDDVRVVLSTDDDEIRLHGRLSRNVEAPFVRPAELATDTASSLDVIRHALDWYRQKEGFVADALILLQPTCPFRDGKHVAEAVQLFEGGSSASVLSVNAVGEHPCEYVQPDIGGFRYVMEPPKAAGRQNFPNVFFINGAIYLCRVDFFLGTGTLFDQSAGLYVMDRQFGLDIDHPIDFVMAEAMIQQYPELKERNLNLQGGTWK